MPSHCSCYLKCRPVSLHNPYFKWHDSIFKFTTKNMGYSACFTIDVNMFWIFILFCFFPCSHKQLCLIKIFNLLYKQLVFIHVFSPNSWLNCIARTKIIVHGDYERGTSISQSQTCPDSCRVWDWGQVDVILHRRQRFNLASCPASLSLPQAARRTNAEPAIATSFSNDLFIVVDVGHASHCDHAGLQHLWRWTHSVGSRIWF